MQRKFRISVDGPRLRGRRRGDRPRRLDRSRRPASIRRPRWSRLRPPSRRRPPSRAARDGRAPATKSRRSAGTVQSVDVTVGQTVEAGDKIATIEAMKMKTEVFAKGAGKVVAIAVKPGDSVDTGGVLLTLA